MDDKRTGAVGSSGRRMGGGEPPTPRVASEEQIIMMRGAPAPALASVGARAGGRRVRARTSVRRRAPAASGRRRRASLRSAARAAQCLTPPSRRVGGTVLPPSCAAAVASVATAFAFSAAERARARSGRHAGTVLHAPATMRGCVVLRSRLCGGRFAWNGGRCGCGGVRLRKSGRVERNGSLS